MKPRPFDYARPDTVEEALELLAEYGDDARILAGGQSLVPMLNLRLIDASGGGPSFCVDSTIDVNVILCLAGYPKPSWQTGLGVPNDQSRDIPDISLDAAGIHDPYLICFEGSCQTIVFNGQTVLESATTVGGTSAAAPSMAGIMALVEQKQGTF